MTAREVFESWWENPMGGSDPFASFEKALTAAGYEIVERKNMPTNNPDSEHRRMALAIEKMTEDEVKPGSVVGVPSGLLYVVQSDELWARLTRHGDMVDVLTINPVGAEWSDATIVWSAP